jgi:ribosomal protein L13E
MMWIGIDISPMPVRHGQTPARRLCLAGKRMLWRAGRGFVVRDLPSQRDNPTIARRFNAGVLAHGHQSHRDG